MAGLLFCCMAGNPMEGLYYVSSDIFVVRVIQGANLIERKNPEPSLNPCAPLVPSHLRGSARVQPSKREAGGYSLGGPPNEIRTTHDPTGYC